MPLVRAGLGGSQAATIGAQRYQPASPYCPPTLNKLVAPQLAIGTTWNPADKADIFALSNDNLTVTRALSATVDWFLRATRAQSAGKRYFEVAAPTVSSGGSTVVGLANATPPPIDSYYVGSDLNSLGYFSTGGWIGNSGSIAAFATWTTGATIGVAIDFTAGKVWFAQNNTWQNGDPATGTGGFTINVPGPLYPALSDSSGVTATANFGASAFTYTAPSGFISWDDPAALNSYSMTATPASFALGAGSATFKRSFPAAATAFTLGAGTVTFKRKFTAAAVSYTLGAGSVTFKRKFTATAASYVLGVGSATLRHGYGLTAAPSSFVLTMGNAAFRWAHRISAVPTAFSLTPGSATFLKGYRFSAAPVAYTLGAGSVALRAAHRLTATAAAYSLAGGSATLIKAPRLVAAPAGYVLTGGGVAFYYNPVGSGVVVPTARFVQSFAGGFAA